MQLLDQPVALVLVHHEREVQIVRSLAHEVDFLFFEELERIAELVQDSANVASHQAHRGARSYHLHAAQPRQVGDQRTQQRVVQRVGRRVE